MFGWGFNPPEIIQTWIEEHYDPASIDGNISLIYERDDIRLCTIQRAVPQQKLGFYAYYHRKEHFHYIQFNDNWESSLTYRAGIKNFDRIIELNGVNIEKDTPHELRSRFSADQHLPVQMLVCSPATYIHYRSTEKPLHSHLRTVHHVKPLYATSTSDSDTNAKKEVSVGHHNFCAVQWENSCTISTVPQSAIFKSPEFTHVNDVCFIETAGHYRKGQIIFKGSCTILEQLPNQLFFYLFTFIDIQHLYTAFWGLNSRLNNMIQSCKNLCLTFDEKTDPLLMKSYSSYVNQLIIQTSIHCDFSQFPNLHTLILCDSNKKHLLQIKSEIIPNLTHLSLLLGSKFIPPPQLICDIFSNKFPSLRHVHLGRIDYSTCHSWTTSPSLQCMSIFSCKSMSILAILTSCPNLHHLQVHIFSSDKYIFTSSAPLNHPLRRLIVWSNYTELYFNDIDRFLAYTPNIEYLYLQTVYSTPFIHLARGLINRLHHLSRFDCYIREILTRDDRVGNLTSIHRIHSCFNKIKCIEENEKCRIFST
ncbi:unnamed protein product [Rotaria sp. Silwood2]|nr:unnamed protein product [Rotaria sp. Silwood2]